MRETTCSLTMIGLSGDDKLAYVMLFGTNLIGQSLVILSRHLKNTRLIETKLKLSIFTLPTTRQNFSVVFKTSQKVCKYKCISKRK